MPAAKLACTSRGVCIERVVVPANDAEINAIQASCDDKDFKSSRGACAREREIGECSFIDPHGIPTVLVAYAPPKPAQKAESLASLQTACTKRDGLFVAK